MLLGHLVPHGEAVQVARSGGTAAAVEAVHGAGQQEAGRPAGGPAPRPGTTASPHRGGLGAPSRPTWVSAHMRLCGVETVSALAHIPCSIDRHDLATRLDKRAVQQAPGRWPAA